MPIKVKQRIVSNEGAKVSLENGSVLDLHRFVLAGKRDAVVFGRKGRVSVVLPKNMGNITISPRVWRCQLTLSIFGRKMTVVVKEIENAKEMDGYKALMRHHYRNGVGATRRAPLVAKIKSPDLPEVVGFVEVTSCFLVNVARRKILDAPFTDKERGIKWERWDMDTAKKYTNVVARISRCVVYPELRGVGIAAVLTKAAIKFAKSRWHIADLRPSFMEITAEMLRYWPFVEKAGFVKVGETEGNDNRLEKSMTYLLNRQEKHGFPSGGGGIMAMYRAHATLLGKAREERKLSVQDMITLVRKSPEQLSVKDWVALHGIYRRPKPVYMIGLTKDAEAHLRDRMRKISVAPPSQKIGGDSKESVSIGKMSIRASCKAESSREARQIQEAFGIVAERLETNIAANLDFTIAPGQVVLVAGASGSGKSLLLRALAWHASGRRKKWKMPPEIQSQANTGASIKVAMMGRPDPKKSPIALLGKLGFNLENAMRLLASAGLGEAQLFVRPSVTLSNGQRYRLALALALAQKPDLLLVDEFCESLDDYSAAAVCRRLRKEINRRGLSAVVATVNGAKITQELRPERILRMLPNRCHKWEQPE